MSKNHPFGRAKTKNRNKDKDLPKNTRPTDQEKFLCKTAWLSGQTETELVKIGNCSPTTLQKWKQQWKNARTDAMMVLRGNQLDLNVTDKEINERRDYIETLRNLKSKHENELDLLETITEKLNIVIDDLAEHPDFEQKDFKQMVAMMKSYAISKTSRSQLQADYIKCCDTLNAETGITAYHKAAGNKVNEVAKAEGRLEIARRRKEEGLETSTEQRKKGFFDV